MREIKFRGQREDTKKWVYGYYVFTNLPQEFLNLAGCLNHNLILTSDGNYYEVIPETVGQFTGLKDKNGVEIYESDIVKVENWYLNQVIKWDKGYFVDTNGMVNLFDSKRELEVIGNIYENP